MLRKERIYLFLTERCGKKSAQDGEKGLSADYISNELKLARSNVSADLNLLYREGRVHKIQGRPTLYLPVECISGKYTADREASKGMEKKGICQSCFRNLIGFDESLKSHVKQAQAAILYPPRGLSTLLLGETGTGKTTFAGYMHEFAVDNEVFGRESPYVVFNCADYANNPQLLMAILFGSVKGAYTGSDSDRVGLVEKADGGMMFLDEVHRLPPEGQEMLFDVIDRGKFRRLGDVAEKAANVLIVAATTQDPKSALLETFLRRFPIIISLPSLRARSIKERANIVSDFFNREAGRVRRAISVSKDVIYALVSYQFHGNVGELKSTIELLCSKGYLDYLINGGHIKIDLNHLPDNIRNVLILNNDQKEEINDIIGFEDKIFSGDKFDGYGDSKDPYDFSKEVYSLLESRSKHYKDMGLPKEEMAHNLNNDLEDILLKYSQVILSFGFRASELSKFLNNRIISIIKQLSEEILIKYNYNMEDSTLVALAFHINSLRIRKNSGSIINLAGVKEKYPVEFEIASYIVERFRNILGYKLAEDEVGFISMILYLTAGKGNSDKKIGIMVIAHGESTASSMAQVANKLLRTDHVRAIDMKLDDSPSNVLNKAIALSKDIDEGKGILLFVDMGSLKVFGREIEKATGIKVMTIDNLSTIALIEAAHKSMLPYSGLKDIAMSILEKNKNIIETTIKEINESASKGGVIFTICSTGEGTAVYLKEVIDRALLQNGVGNIQTIEMSISDKKEAVDNMRRLAGRRDILAVAGSIDPDYPGVPFLSLIEFVTGNGLEKVVQLAARNRPVNIKAASDSRTVIYGAICDALDENLHFISGRKIMPYLNSYAEQFEERMGIKLDSHMYTVFTMHLAYAIERLKFNGKNDGIAPDFKNETTRQIYEDFGVLLDENDEEIFSQII